MPMGLINTLAIFASLMQSCLVDENFKSLIIYLDDILVYVKYFSEMILRLRIMFIKLRDSILINNLSCRVMFFW